MLKVARVAILFSLALSCVCGLGADPDFTVTSPNSTSFIAETATIEASGGYTDAASTEYKVVVGYYDTPFHIDLGDPVFGTTPDMPDDGQWNKELAPPGGHWRPPLNTGYVRVYRKDGPGPNDWHLEDTSYFTWTGGM